MNNEQVYIDAVKSDFLDNRSTANKKFAESDFDSWVESIINKIKFSNVFDICCGTGNQLILYAKKLETLTLTGADISPTSLGIANSRLSAINDIDKTLLIEGEMDNIFSSDSISTSKFDLISCFYGLYYAKNTPLLLDNVVEHLADDGHILIVGPYGDNNKVFFNILEKYFELPELVYRSSCTFMENEVLPALAPKLEIEKRYFLNKIRYPDVSSVMNYWKSTTFFNSNFEKNVQNDLEIYFQSNNEFIIEKHVMAILAKNNA
jgi:ubiquinone/menaquinone biosynthesis C-methylase UbiE